MLQFLFYNTLLLGVGLRMDENESSSEEEQEYRDDMDANEGEVATDDEGEGEGEGGVSDSYPEASNNVRKHVMFSACRNNLLCFSFW